MTMGFKIRAAVLLLAVSRASSASADIVSVAALISSPSSSHVSIASPSPFGASVPSLASGPHAGASSVMRAAFGPLSQPGSRTLADLLPPSADVDDAPDANPAVIVLQLGSPASPGRGPSRFVYDENPGTSSNNGTGTSIVPLPPAVFGGLAGLATLAIGRSLIRRGRSA